MAGSAQAMKAWMDSMEGEDGVRKEGGDRGESTPRRVRRSDFQTNRQASQSVGSSRLVSSRPLEPWR